MCACKSSHARSMRLCCGQYGGRKCSATRPSSASTACRPQQAARRISDLYARRFDIEELFRDAKSGQFGYALSQTRITRPDRLDRLILILVLAYPLLVGLGLWAKRNLPPRLWASTSRRDECSAFTVGRLLLDHRPATRPRLLLELLASIRRVGRNWG